MTHAITAYPAPTMFVQFSGRTLTWPARCACCGSQADTEREASFTRVWGKRVVKSHTRSWSVPYCSGCAAHVAAWPREDPNGCFLALVTCGLYFGIKAVLDNGARARSRSMCGHACASPFHGVEYRGWDGTVHSFVFQSAAYGTSFAEMNGSKIVGLDHRARAVLAAKSEHDARAAAHAAYEREVARARRRAAEAEAAAAAEARLELEAQERAFRTALEKIESAKGPAARRNALEAATKVIPRGPKRDLLLLEASKLEVAAVLDKVDALKTPAAKRRHLQAALDHLRGDDVPDELQGQQIAWLEEALRATEVG